MDIEPAEVPALVRLWDAVAARLQRNGLQAKGAVRIDDLSHDERRALAGLLGRRIDGGTSAVTIDLARLDARLRRAGTGGLVAVAERRRGPLLDHLAVRSARIAAEVELWATARELIAGAGLEGETWVEPWLAAIRPIVHRAEHGDRSALVAVAVRTVAAVITSRSPRGRGELATSVAGSAHALDDGRRLSALVLRALALRADLLHPLTAAQRRDVWRSAGVLCDEVSTTVLTAGLRPHHADPVGAMVVERTELGLPTHLTWRDLDRLRWSVPGRVSVCENPRVIECAVDERVDSPVVCTQGNPTVVTRRLLAQLATAGATFRYHGDFDWPGIAIANGVLADLPGIAWRFRSEDYIEGLERAGALAVELPSLGDRSVDASWDESLSTAMRRHGRAVHEELILDLLIEDLRP